MFYRLLRARLRALFLDFSASKTAKCAETPQKKGGATRGNSLVHHDPVVVLATSVASTSRMLAVLPDAAVSRGDVAALLAVLAEAWCEIARGSWEGAEIEDRVG
jgi:hypothetical protein